MTNLLRKSLKIPACLWGACFREKRPGVSFLIYHMVGGELPMEIDLPYPLFKRQMERISKSSRAASYEEALEILKAGKTPEEDLFVLTFDDGYADFSSRAFPLLRDLGMRSALFVSTGFMETGTPNPYGSIKEGCVRPLSWDELGRCVETGLVTLGAHTHTHRDMASMTEEEAIEEFGMSDEIFIKRLGMRPSHFAYPRGLWGEGAERAVRRHYASAVLGGGKKALPQVFDPHRIPRIPVRRSDGWAFFVLKTMGFMEAEEALYSAIRRVKEGS